jgi:hypothetical protein
MFYLASISAKAYHYWFKKSDLDLDLCRLRTAFYFFQQEEKSKDLLQVIKTSNFNNQVSIFGFIRGRERS